MERNARISDCGKYRYTLARHWGLRKRRVVFVMLNPSTADGLEDDPTIRRCISFAQAWGYGGLHVLNLFAFRATDPKALKIIRDPIGPENDKTLRMFAHGHNEFVCAWGAYKAPERVEFLRSLDVRLSAIRLTKSGAPGHPLYLPAGLQRVEFGRRDDGWA